MKQLCKKEMINIKNSGRSCNKDRNIFGVSLEDFVRTPWNASFMIVAAQRNKKERFRIIMKYGKVGVT